MWSTSIKETASEILWPGWYDETKTKCIERIKEGHINDAIISWAAKEPEIFEALKIFVKQNPEFGVITESGRILLNIWACVTKNTQGIVPDWAKNFADEFQEKIGREYREAI